MVYGQQCAIPPDSLATTKVARNFLVSYLSNSPLISLDPRAYDRETTVNSYPVKYKLFLQLHTYCIFSSLISILCLCSDSSSCLHTYRNTGKCIRGECVHVCMRFIIKPRKMNAVYTIDRLLATILQ